MKGLIVMKKRLLLLLVLCVMLTACGVQIPTDQDLHTVPPTTQTLQPTTAPLEPDPVLCLDGFTLGMTPDQLFEQVGALDLEIEMPNYDETPLPPEAADAAADGRIYNMTDLSFYYKLRDHDTYFTFSQEGELVTISNQDPEIRSHRGLEIGCSLDTAIEIYGLGYVENPEDYSVLRYDAPDGYICIFYEDHTVTGWRLSKYENINND